MFRAKICPGRLWRTQVGLFPVLAAFLLTALSVGVVQAAEMKVAVFDFELIDSSLEGQVMGKNADEQERLGRLAPSLREKIGGLESYVIVDIAPVREKAQSQHLQSCGRCAEGFAREVGADIAVIGTVQKVSNLILNINAYAFDAETGEPIARGSADIRSNTDTSWQRGIDYLWENVLRTQFKTHAASSGAGSNEAAAPEAPEPAQQ